MNRRTIKGIIYFLITAVLSAFFLSGQPAYATGTSVIYAAPENVRAARNSNTSVRLSWKPDAEADGYIIYRFEL